MCSAPREGMFLLKLQLFLKFGSGLPTWRRLATSTGGRLAGENQLAPGSELDRLRVEPSYRIGETYAGKTYVKPNAFLIVSVD